MTVYVDELMDFHPKKYGHGRWCHLMTDQDDLGELHELAGKIGLRREWFQDHPRHPHYDVVPSMREKAVRAGAVSIGATEMLLRCLRMGKQGV